MLNNYLENVLTLYFKRLFIWPKLRIPSHLCDLRLSVSSGCGRLACRAFVFFKEPLLNGTRARTHTLYLICTSRFRPLLLKLNLTSIVLGHLNNGANEPHIRKNKRKEKNKENIYINEKKREK